MAESLSIGWQARIQTRTLGSTDSPQDTQLIDARVYLPPDHIFQMLIMTFDDHIDKGRFMIPDLTAEAPLMAWNQIGS